MRTKVEIGDFEITIEENEEGVITVSAEKDGETVEEFTLSAEESEEGAEEMEEMEESEEDMDLKGFDEYSEEDEEEEEEEEEEEMSEKLKSNGLKSFDKF